MKKLFNLFVMPLMAMIVLFYALFMLGAYTQVINPVQALAMYTDTQVGIVVGMVILSLFFGFLPMYAVNYVKTYLAPQQPIAVRNMPALPSFGITIRRNELHNAAI